MDEPEEYNEQRLFNECLCEDDLYMERERIIQEELERDYLDD